MSNSAGSREISLWKWGLIGLLLWIVGYLFFAQQETVSSRISAERHGNQQFLGQAASEHAENRAANWFKTIALDDGLLAKTFRVTTPSSSTSDSQVGQRFGRALGPIQAWATERVRVMWAMFYQFLIRVSVSMLWWPYLLVGLLPFTVDAVVQRKIKSANFGLSSPHTFVVGRHLIFLSPLVYTLLLLIPVTLPTVIMPAMCLVLCLSLWAAIVNFAKRA